MRSVKAYQLLIFLPLFLFWHGCIGLVEPANKPGSGQKGTLFQTCKANSDCGKEEECSFERCVPLPNLPCQTKCEKGERCKGLHCIKDPIRCFGDCEKEDRCIDGICTGKTSTCLVECPKGKQCVNGKCLPNSPTNPSKKCDANEILVDGKCVFDLKHCCEPGCSNGRICQNRRCVSPDPANACSPSCRAKEVCKAGRCEPCESCELPGLGENCHGKSCRKGLTCVSFDVKRAFCFRDCKENPSICIKKGLQCRDVQGGGKICLEEKSAGEECGLRCHSRAFCKKGLSCLQGICQAPKEVGLYESCGIGSKSCKQGTLCLALQQSSGRKFCFEACDPKRPSCKNKVNCIDLGQGKGVCKPIGEAQLGDSCKAINYKAEKLNLHEYCTPGLFCVGGVCKKSGASPLYEKCGVDGKTCDVNKDFCFKFGTKSPHGYCLKRCDPSDPNPQCGQGKCFALSQVAGVCVPYGQAKDDQFCDIQNGEKMDVSKLCKAGLICVDLGRRICKTMWEGSCKTPGKSCPSGMHCSEQSIAGKQYAICFLSCPKGICSNPNLECRKTPSGAACWPRSIQGTVPFGGKCDGSKRPSYTCQGSLKCALVQQGAKYGFCTKSCQSNSDCPSVTNKKGDKIPSTCIVQAKLCAFRCDSPQPICPDNLSCINKQVCGP